MSINVYKYRFDTLDSNAVDYIRRNMMEYLGREFVDNNSASNEESCTKGTLSFLS